jgi:type IV pilus assembly protein PilW
VNGAGEYGVVVEELVEGIEDMQVLYGEDTNGDGTANYYVPFDEIADADDVISIRVSLLVRSIEDNIVQGTQTLIYNGSNTPFSDGHLRKVFTSTIALRNRL